MKIAIVTSDGFNQFDCLVAASIVARMKSPDWQADITAPTETVISMNRVTIRAQQALPFANTADVVIFSSEVNTRTIVEDKEIIRVFKLNLTMQLAASQCSGALLLHKLGLLSTAPISSDEKTKLYLEIFGGKAIN